MTVAGRGRALRRGALPGALLSAATPFGLRIGSIGNWLQEALARWGAVGLFAVGALGVAQFYAPPGRVGHAPFARTSRGSLLPAAVASGDAFGSSRQVKLRFAMPGDVVEFPLEIRGEPAGLTYQWVAINDTESLDTARRLAGAKVVAPARPGFYHLALLRGQQRQLMAEPTLAVMVPFSEKVGGWLHGYRIGTYLAERLGGLHDRPDGFLEVGERDLDLEVSKHFRLADFLNRDGQGEVWPKYVALNPRLLDKLELVLAKLGERRGGVGDVGVALDVHSGFRTPVHNSHVGRSARDSRHQYGDAADLVIDANGDGKITTADAILVARAVDQVEEEHPELAGGLGLYTSRDYRTPYVHIDARGRRSRWRG